MVNFWQRKYYFCCNESAQLSLEKNTLANEAISKYKRETALRRSLWQLPNRHCERVHFTNEAISKYERETASLRSQWQQTVIARGRTLRSKPSLSTRGRLLYFVRSNKKLSLRESVLCERSNLRFGRKMASRSLHWAKRTCSPWQAPAGIWVSFAHDYSCFL